MMLLLMCISTSRWHDEPILPLLNGGFLGARKWHLNSKFLSIWGVIIQTLGRHFRY
jgi:hypothetical protein